jgi:hypothetical protein
MVLRSIVMRVLPRHRFVWVACGWGPIGIHRDRMRLLDRTACRTIRDIRAREFERPPAAVAAAGVELRGMVCEGEQVSPKKLIEANRAASSCVSASVRQRGHFQQSRCSCPSKALQRIPFPNPPSNQEIRS